MAIKDLPMEDVDFRGLHTFGLEHIFRNRGTYYSVEAKKMDLIGVSVSFVKWIGKKCILVLEKATKGNT